MSFWWVAAAVAVVAALMMFWPLVRLHRTTGLALVALVPVLGLVLYFSVGTPEGIDVIATPQVSEEVPGLAPTGNFDELVVALQERLDNNPGDLEGWMLLGRSYKTLQQYDRALEAHRRAQALAPDDPFVQVELAEALIFNTGEAGISPEVRPLIDSALATEPNLQKGLWLMGILESQAGNDQAALGWWERLLPLLEPGSGVEQSVREQANLARQRLGLASAPVATPAPPVVESDWAGVDVSVQLPEGVTEVPNGAVLFIVARDPAAPRPPLGAMRLDSPTLPLSVRLTDANSMMPQRPISSAETIEVVARLSLSGQPIAQPGDWESEAVTLEGDAPLQLTLTQP